MEYRAMTLTYAKKAHGTFRELAVQGTPCRSYGVYDSGTTHMLVEGGTPQHHARGAAPIRHGCVCVDVANGCTHDHYGPLRAMSHHTVAVEVLAFWGGAYSRAARVAVAPGPVDPTQRMMIAVTIETPLLIDASGPCDIRQM